MRPLNEKDGGDGGSFPPGALLRADSHRLLAGESSLYASAQAGGGRSSSMTHFADQDRTYHDELVNNLLICKGRDLTTSWTTGQNLFWNTRSTETLEEPKI
ncbi:MAG: hypothetical protein IPL59_11995 [Candidatus Competibacteraceae bacterium]|nr:hypothetical protein [Candidatus Competibacteraceae bacterium]